MSRRNTSRWYAHHVDTAVKIDAACTVLTLEDVRLQELKQSALEVESEDDMAQLARQLRAVMRSLRHQAGLISKIAKELDGE